MFSSVLTRFDMFLTCFDVPGTKPAEKHVTSGQIYPKCFQNGDAKIRTGKAMNIYAKMIYKRYQEACEINGFRAC